MSKKYQPLEEYLKGQPQARTHVTLRFQDIENLIGHALPASAYRHRAWWSNQTDVSNRSQAGAWQNAGFKVEYVEPGNEDSTVLFARTGSVSGSCDDEFRDGNAPISERSGAELLTPDKRISADHPAGTEIVLLSCVKSKRDYSCQAGDMYTSPLFQKMMAYARSRNPKKVFILSAKYGLLNPEDIIEPYEQTLKNMSADERYRWAQAVVAQIRDRSDLDADKFVLLAGLPYRENLVAHLRHYAVPMEGLSFGKQLQWLDEQLR